MMEQRLALFSNILHSKPIPKTHLTSPHPLQQRIISLCKWGNIVITAIVSGNDLTSFRCKAIAWISDDLLWSWSLEANLMKSELQYNNHHSRNCIWKYRLQDVGHFIDNPLFLDQYNTDIHTQLLPYMR